MVLTQEEVRVVSERVDGTEALRLRVQDLDFRRKVLTVRDGRGGKDRRILLHLWLGDPLRPHLEQVRWIHLADLAAGYGQLKLPYLLAPKYLL